MCVKYERFRRCKGGKNRINAPSVANFARKLKNNAAEERESLLLKMCELGGVGVVGQRGVDETRGNISDTFTSTSSLKPSSKDWLLSPESPQQDWS